MTVFAAFLPAAVVEPRVAAERGESGHGRRIGDAISPQCFAQEVAEARSLGYATAIGSPIPGINAVSAPVFDHTGQMQLAVTLIGSAASVDVAQGSPHVRRLLDFTAQLSAQLGHDGGASRTGQAAGDGGEMVVHLVPKAATEEASSRRGRKRRA